MLDIARHYDLGYDEIIAPNPGVSIWVPGAGTRLVIPTEFILPPQPWRGIVINIPQRRLYYFPRSKGAGPATVVTFPIGIARAGWPTPLGKTSIIAKFKDPSWIVPKNIQQEHRLQGEANFPDYFPPGPNNPMGMLALETGFSQIYIHGTNRPWGVGMRVSHGCIHLYPEDAAFMFAHVPVGTPVTIINRPLLLGKRNKVLYLSAFKPMTEYPEDQDSLSDQSINAVVRYKEPNVNHLPRIDWNRLQQVAKIHRIIPIPVSVDAPDIGAIIVGIRTKKYHFEPYGIDANDAGQPLRAH